MSTTGNTSTPTTPAPSASDVPRVVLPAGALACLACGQVVPADEHERAGRVTVTALRREIDPPGDPANPRPLIETEFSWCRTCAAREEAAGLVVDDLPALAGRLGRATARHRLACALDALAAAGLPYPSDFTADEVSALLRHLAALGGSVRWAALYAPVMRRGAMRDSAAARPWDHVSDEQRAEVRRAHAGVLAARVARSAPPSRLAPPSGRACLFCGLGHVVVTAARASALGGHERARTALWSLRSAAPTALGGRPSPRPLSGHLCPDCTEAVDTVGAVGHTAMLRAYAAHLRRAGRTREADAVRTLDGVSLIGWAAFDHDEQRAGRPPLPTSATAWAHVTLALPGYVATGENEPEEVSA